MESMTTKLVIQKVLKGLFCTEEEIRVTQEDKKKKE
jgi:hypothetical protein